MKRFLAPERFDPLKTTNHCFICTNHLPNKLCLLNGNPDFRLRLHHLNFLAPVTKLLGSDSTALLDTKVRTREYPACVEIECQNVQLIQQGS